MRYDMKRRRAVLAGAAMLAAVLSAPCSGDAQIAAPELLETTWKLVRLGDKPAGVPGGQPPYLVLQRIDRRVSGSGGCNRIAGGYLLDGASLRLEGLISTRMACMEGMDQEQAFLTALDHVAKWRIASDELTLSDADGHALAVFQMQRLD
jgi:heat shock protein HslJ